MEKYQNVEQPSLRKIFARNFIDGIGWALGATVGISILLAILAMILRQISFVPIVGNFISQITAFVLQKNPHLIK